MDRQTPSDSSALQRVLAYGAAGLVGLALVTIGVILAATAAGAGADHGFEKGAWPVIVNLPTVALPLGFVLIIVLLATNGARRSRQSRR